MLTCVQLLELKAQIALGLMSQPDPHVVWWFIFNCKAIA